MKYTKIPDFELCRYTYLFPSILDLYPESVLKKNLRGIVLLGSLSFYDVGWGGTYLNDIVCLTSEGRNQGYNDDNLRKIFHHEMSSVFFDKYEFDIIKWHAANPTNFNYMKTKNEILAEIQQKDDGKISDSNLFKQGFLSSYCKSTLENDFNTYVENIFVKPERMRQLIDQYPIVKKKYLIVKSFYIDIDKHFSSVFDKIL